MSGTSVGSIYAQMILDTSDYEKGLKSIVSSTASASEKSANSFYNISDALGKTTKQVNKQKEEVSELSNAFMSLGGIIGGAAILGGIRSMVMESAKIETIETSFNVMLGSAEKAKTVLGELNQFSLATPFTPDQVYSAGKALMAFGIQSDQLIPKLTNIGNIASGVGADFNSLSTIYGKAFISGNIYAEDLNQIIDAGIPIIGELANVMGTTENKIKKLASEGKIGFDQLDQAFQNLSGSGGKFEGMMIAQSQTLDGMLSTAQGNLSQLSVLIGKTFAPFVKALVSGFNTIVESVIQFQESFPVTFAIITQVAGGITLLVTALIGGAGLKIAIVSLIPIIKVLGVTLMKYVLGAMTLIAAHPVTATLIAIGVAVSLVAREVIKNWSQVKPVIQPLLELFNQLKNSLQPIITLVSSFFKVEKSVKQVSSSSEEASENINILGTIGKIALGGLSIVIEAVVRGFSILLRSVILVISSLYRLYKGIIQLGIGQVTDAITTFKEGFENAKISIEGIVTEAKALGSGISKTFQEMQKPVVNLKDEVKKTKNEIKKTKQELDGLPDKTPQVKKEKPEKLEKPEKIEPEKIETFEERSVRLSLTIDTGMFKDIEKFFDMLGEKMSLNLKAILSTASQLIGGYSNYLNKMAQAEQQNFQNKQQQLATISQYGTAIIDRQLEQTLASYDLELQALEEHKNRLIQVEENYQQLREELRNSEIEKIRERIEQEYQLQAQKLQMEHQQELDNQAANMLDEEQLRLNNERLEEEHLAQLSDLRIRYDEMTAEEIRALTEKMSQEDENRVSWHNANMEKIALKEKEIQDRITAEKEKAQKQKEKLEKKAILMEWIHGRKAFEIGKKSQMASVKIQMAQGLMSAVVAGALLAASVPILGKFLGPALAIALSAMVMSAGKKSLSVIGASQYPPPPATAFALGGLVTGGQPGIDSVPAMLTPGELIVPAQNYEEVVSAVGEQRASVKSINITGNNFYGIHDPESFIQIVKTRILEESRHSVGAFA